MTDNLFDDALEEDDNWVSRSQLKREAQDLQSLAQSLVALKPEQLAKVPLDTQTLRSVEEAARIKPRSGAMKRQIQYIGKLLRNLETDPIFAALERMDTTSAAYNQIFHRLERWRDRLIAEDSEIIPTLLAEYPEADLQHIRQLVRNAQREVKQQKPPASARKLFKYLRELEESNQ